MGSFLIGRNEQEPPEFEFEVVQENDQSSFGNGCGTMYEVLIAHSNRAEFLHTQVLDVF